MPETSVIDAGLMWQVAHGKRESLEKLVRRHASGLLTFIVGMIGDQHRGEELFQEVVLAVWSKRRQYLYRRWFRLVRPCAGQTHADGLRADGVRGHGPGA